MPENKYERIPQPIIAASLASSIGLLAASALRIDQRLGRSEIVTEQSNPEFIVTNKSNADRTIVLLGGLCMNTESLGKRFAKQLPDDTNLVSPIFPKACFNPEQIFEETLRHTESTKPRDVIIAGFSMGGLLGLDLMNYGTQTGKTDVINNVSHFISRGTPFSNNAIRPGPRLLLQLADKMGYSYTLNHGRSLLKKWDCKSLIEANPATVVPQCHYLASKHAAQLEYLPERITYITGNTPDPIVNETTSIAALNTIVGRPVEIMTDPGNHDAQHAPTDGRSIRFMLDQLLVKPNQHLQHAAA